MNASTLLASLLGILATGGAAAAAASSCPLDVAAERPPPGIHAPAVPGLRTDPGLPEEAPSFRARLQAATLAVDALRGSTDPRAHARIAGEVEALAALAPQHPRVLALQAWRAMAGHRFAEALALANRALRADRRERIALALRADALTELGRYAEAVAAVEALDEAGAALPALVRAAHLRRLHGDLPGAMEATEEARRRAVGTADRVWLARELAVLYWHGGDDQCALRLLAGLPDGDGETETRILRARVLESSGDLAAARAEWQRLADGTPLPAAMLGLWRTAADPVERRRLAHQLEGMARLDEGQGGLARRDFVEFFARTGRLDRAEALARAEYERRPDVFGAAQLGWVLARAGKHAEAASRLGEAARLGSVDRILSEQLGVARATVADAGRLGEGD